MSDYRFIDKDPVIDLIRTAYHEGSFKIKDVAAKSRVHPNTISRWLYGDVKRPQNYTIMRVMEVMGYRLAYLDCDGNELVVIKGVSRKFKHVGASHAKH